MRHLTAVHLDAADDLPEGWHYASLGKRGGGPIGDCANHAPHATEEQARWCYTDYLRENIEKRPNASSWTTCRFDGCGKPARNVAQSGEWHYAVMCDEHFTDWDAVVALGLDCPAGDSWQS